MGWPDPSVEIPDQTPYMPRKSNDLWGKIKSQPFKYVLLGLVILVLLVIILIIYQRFIMGFTDWANWTGFGEYQGKIAKDDRGKTLWDWMELILIPAFLAFGAILINWKIGSVEKERMLDQQSEIALQTYINKVTEFLLNQQNEPLDEKVLMLARIHTITTLRSLDGVRKGILIQFLYEAGLINRLSGEGINLKWANLTDSQMDYLILLSADLSGSFLINASLKFVFMRGSNLSMTNLSFANLENAYLRGSDLNGAIMKKANLKGVDLSDAHLEKVDLTGAKLNNAFLASSYLTDAILTNADFTNVNLIETDLKGAILKDTCFKNALMPDGERYDPKKHTVKYLTAYDEET